MCKFPANYSYIKIVKFLLTHTQTHTHTHTHTHIYIYMRKHTAHLKVCRQREIFTGLVKKTIYQLLKWKILFLRKISQNIAIVFIMFLGITFCWHQEEVNASVSVLVAVLKNCKLPTPWDQWTALPLAKIRPPQISPQEGGGGVFQGIRNHKDLSRALPNWFPFFWQKAVFWIHFVKSGSHPTYFPMYFVWWLEYFVWC